MLDFYYRIAGSWIPLPGEGFERPQPHTNASHKSQ
jgi:hypothetical protein